MAIGGSTAPSDGNTYNLNLIKTELSQLFSKNLIFDSYNGSININGISNGEIKFISSTQNCTYQYIMIWRHLHRLC